MDKKKNNDHILNTKKPPVTGTANLAIGGGFAAYGATLGMVTGSICPVCLIATPIFIGLGGVQKCKYLLSQRKDETHNPSERVPSPEMNPEG